MDVIDNQGVPVVRLTLDDTDATNLTWKGTSLNSGAYVLKQNDEKVLAIVANLKSRDNGGKPEEMIQIQEFNVTVEGQWSVSTFRSEQQAFTFPQFQTVQGQIVNVSNVLASQGTLMRTGTQLLGAFSFSGTSVPGAPPPSIENLEFNVSKSASVVVTDWTLSAPGSSMQYPCSVNGTTISCLTIPAELGAVGPTPRVLNLYGTVAVDQAANDIFLQVQLVEPGSTTLLGAVQWSDGSGHYRWLDVPYPVAQSTLWKN